MKSVLVLVALVGSSVLFLGCPMCNCPDTVPYTRWNEFALLPDEASYVADADSLNFTLEVIEIEYLAQESRKTYGGDAAMACSCAENGWNGFKYPLDSVRFTTRSDWDADHPAGSSLNDITQYFDYNYSGLGPAQWVDFDDPTVLRGYEYEYFFNFRFTAGPAVLGNYEVEATIYYSNGASLEGQSMTMTIQ